MDIISAVFTLAGGVLAFILVLLVIALPFIAVALIVIGTLYFILALPEALLHYQRTRRWRLLSFFVIFPGVYFGRGRGW